MLHILFLILKIIGIILAVILGILVLLICVVLFMPVSYQGSAKCDGTPESLSAIIKVTWLFSLLKINAKYENGKLKYSVQIAWKKLLGGKNHEKSNEEIVGEKTSSEESATESISIQESEKVVEKPKENLESDEQKVEKRSSISEKTEEKTSLTDKIRNKVNNLKQKVLNFFEKIKCTTKNICDKLKMVLEKKEKVMLFVKDENHKKAFSKIKKEVFKLLKRLKPKQYLLKARYGFEDPSLTGKILAILSVIYPFTEDHMDVIPDFENKILQGRMMIKGKIYVICFVCTAWNLIWCKKIRRLYKDFRNFKL